ncbi:MAG: Dabb family protein [Verrucomicrobiota bacterium]
MITHVVIFWTDKTNSEGREALQKGCKELISRIPGVLEFRFGQPVSSNRGVVDDSFSLAISMTFENQKAAETYQEHSLHKQFVNEYVKKYVKRFVVYDWS